MLVIKNDLSYYTISGINIDNWLPEGVEIPDDIKYVLDDDHPLYEKIINSPCFELVEDSNGDLIDVIVLDPLPPSAEEQILSITQKLDEIDIKTVRPLRAIISGQGTKADEERLQILEQEAEELREQINELRLTQN